MIAALTQMLNTEIRDHPKRIRAVGILTVLGTPFYIACFLSHVCMDGHMRHGPYGAAQWMNDLLWMACFVAVGVISITLRARDKALFSIGSFLLVFSRLLAGSAGGTNEVIELPLLVLMNVYACRYMIWPAAVLWKEESTSALETTRKTRISFCLVGLLIIAVLAVWQYLQW